MAGSAVSLRDHDEPANRTKRARVDSCVVENCHSTAEVFNLQYTEDAYVYNTTFVDNSALSWNGVLYFREGQRAVVENSTFSRNTMAGGNGGAISTGKMEQVVVRGCLFSGNTAGKNEPDQGAGGAINFY